jgi:dTDP-4-amino-4,6-dideoxygalactose transaminase
MIAFGDSKGIRNCPEIDEAMRSVCRNGWFVLGRQGEEFETASADYIGGTHAVGVGSGQTRSPCLVASGVGYGDYVITVPNTAVPTVSAISLPVRSFWWISIRKVTPWILPAHGHGGKEKKRLGSRLKAVVPVHLFGQSAPMEPIVEIAKEFDIKVIEDACQAHGALYQGRKVGSLGDYAAFSFYPSKNLGAYGDGGMVLTKDSNEARKIKMLRNYGQEKRYYHRIKGFNSRLDELQAAFAVK